MIPQDLTYDFPWGALALFLTFLFPWLFWVLFSKRKKVLNYFAAPSVLEQILEPRSPMIFWCKVLAIALVWLFAVFALMQPKGNAHYPEEALNLPDQKKHSQENLAKVRRKAHEVIFLLDASASMSVPDSRTGATRLDFAKEISDQIVSRLRGESGALYAYTSEPTQLSPLTTDYLFLRLMIRQIKINEGDLPGSDIKNVLEEMRRKYFSHPDSKLKTLILLSDGGDNTIESLQGEQRESAVNSLLDLLNNAEQNHLRVYTIGMGSLEGQDIPNLTYNGKPVHSALNEELLRKIAHRGRGIYYPARDYTSIDLSKDIVESMNQDSPFLEEETMIRSLSGSAGDAKVFDLYYQIPLGLALLFLGYVLFWPDVRKPSIKINKSVLIIFLTPFVSWNLYAIGEDSFNEASLYFQAGDYAHAQQIYEELLEGKNTQWKKAVIAYNLGSTYLKEGQYEKAITAFREIALGPDSHPLLNFRIKVNLALALLEEADHLKIDRVDQLEKSLYTYREALDEIALAIKAECILEKAEGSSTCHPSPDLKDLKTYAKILYAFRAKQLIQLRVQQAGWSEGIPLLIISLNQLLGEISILESKQMNKNLREQYGNLIEKEAVTWQQLWNAIQTKMDVKDSKPYQEAFKEAKTTFDQGVVFLKKYDFDTTRKKWEGSLSALKSLMAKIFKGDPTQEVLRKLLALYNYAHVQTPLQESTVAALESEQEEILSLIPAQFRPALEKGQQALVQAYSALQASKPLTGRFYIVFARHIVRALLRQEFQKQSTSSTTTLEAALEDQQTALALNRLMHSIQANEIVGGDLLPIVQFLQKEVLQTASPFLEKVMQEQRKEFDQGLCQAHPWDEALPLFYEGLQAAHFAESRGGGISLKKQELAVVKWQQALEKMKLPKSAFSGSCKGDGEKKENKNKEPAKEENKAEKPKTSMEEVLRQLIEMDQDDRLPQESSALQVKGIKPW